VGPKVSNCARGSIRARWTRASLALLTTLLCPSAATAWFGVPPWLSRLIATYSLEPPENRPQVIRRFGYQGQTGYCFSVADPPEPETLFLDADGNVPESTFDGDAVAVCRGPAVWRAPAARDASAPTAVLADSRFQSLPVLRAYARLEQDWGVAWLAGWTRWPPRTFEHAEPDRPLGILQRKGEPATSFPMPGASADAALEFLRQYRDLFGIVDPAVDLTLSPNPPEPHEIPYAITWAQGQKLFTFDQVFSGRRSSRYPVVVVFDDHGRVAAVWSNYQPELRDAIARVEAEARRLHAGVPIRTVSHAPLYGSPFQFDVVFDGTIPGVAGTPMGRASYRIDSVTGAVVEIFP